MGTVVEATIPEGSNKLIRQVVDFGDEIGNRIIFSGIKQWYSPEELVGKQLPYLINLEPRKMMGEESQGMLVAAGNLDHSLAVLLEPDQKVENGSSVS
jgi:methionyl-tRNA synthetase